MSDNFLIVDGVRVFPEGRKSVIASLRQRIRAATSPTVPKPPASQGYHAVCERCRARERLHIYRSHSTHGVALCSSCAVERGYPRWFAEQERRHG